jgi:hypothetical protein
MVVDAGELAARYQRLGGGSSSGGGGAVYGTSQRQQVQA